MGKQQTPLAGEEKQAKVYEVFQSISEDYDRMNDVISFGQHRAWKRKLINAVTQAGYTDILDVASGTGDIAIWLAERNPKAHLVASDFSENMLSVAQRRIDESGLTNVSISHQNAMEMSFADNSFDCVVISFALRNMPDYGQVVSEIARVLRPGGRFLCLDSSYPTSPFIKPFFKMYFRYIMPLLGKMLVDAPGQYQWLNDSTEAFLSKEELAELLRTSGLTEVSYKSLTFGVSALHTGVKPKA